MKKMAILAGMAVILVLSIVGGQLLFGNNLQAATVSDTTTTQYIMTNDDYYYYTDYQELISKIYDDVYDEFYNDIYDQVTSEINDALYQQIYDSVAADLEDLLTQNELGLYIDDFQQQIYSVIDLAEQSVYGITSFVPDEGTAIGSGVVFRYDEANSLYYIVTNYHVISNYVEYVPSPEVTGQPGLEIRFSDGSSVDATLYGYDTEVDLAFLTFSSVGLDGIVVSEFADSETTGVGDFVLAVGNPMGYDFYNSVTMGIVSGLDRDVDQNGFVKYIQHDAAINSGNSGGPIYNLDGEVVGINVLKYATVEIEGMGFSIPISYVERVLERLDAGTLDAHTIMPRIGASYYVLNEQDIQEGVVTLPSITVNTTEQTQTSIILPSGITQGLVLNLVTAGETLDGYLDGGDLIVSVGGYQIQDEADFLAYLYNNYESGDSVSISYYAYNSVSHTYATSPSSITVEFK